MRNDPFDQDRDVVDLDTLLHPAQAFGHPSEVVADPDLTINDAGVRYANVITTLFIPQRSILFGWPLLFFALALLIESLKESPRPDGRSSRTQPWLRAGVLASLLPLVHSHSFAVLCFCALFFATLAGPRALVAFGRGVLPLALPAILFMATRNSLATEKFLGWQPGFDGGAAERYYNELAHAREVARLFGTDHHEILVRPNVASLLPKLLWHLDEPIADSAFVTTYLVAEFARRDVKVILSGVGGDELFGGYRRYLGEHYMRYVDWLPTPAKRGAARLADWLPGDRHSKWLNYSRLAKNFLGAAASPFIERYRAYVGAFPPDVVAALMVRPAHERFDAIGEAFLACGGEDPLARMFGVDAHTQLPDDLLKLTDKMTMAASIECRVPLLDHELVELAAQIPASIKVAGGELKSVLKKALADVLPREVLYREKRGFGAPMGAWLKGSLATMLDSALSRESLLARGLLNPAPVAQLIADHRANRVDGTDKLLALLNLEIWCRVTLDGRAAQDVADELEEAVA